MLYREEEALRVLAYYHADGNRCVPLFHPLFLHDPLTNERVQEGPARGVRVRGDPDGDQVRSRSGRERRLAEPRAHAGQQEEAEDHGRARVLLSVERE